MSTRLLLALGALAMVGLACDSAKSGAAADSAESAVLPDTLPCYNFIYTKWTPAKVSAAKFVVNTQTRGMTARVRWALSPDSASMIVVEDPSGVENAQIPDGALFVNEKTGRTFHVDSVWSVAPSPDWTKLMFGKASVVSATGGDSIPASRWAAAAKSLSSVAGPQPGLVAESLKAKARSINGMTEARGVSAAFSADVGRDTARTPITFMGVGGWTVAWSCAVSPKGNAKEARAAEVPWLMGPTLEIAAPLKQSPPRYFDVRARRVSGKDGVITVLDSGKSTPRVIGNGLLLGATKYGHFVLAIAPREKRGPNESPEQAVVYRVP